MKKLITLCFSALMVLNASAVSVSWTSTAVSFDGGSTLKNEAKILGHVVYLGSGGDFADSYAVGEDFDATKVGAVGSSDTDGTSKAGKSAGTFSFEEGTKVNGDAFGLLLKYTNDSGVYWNLSSNKNALSGLVAGDPTYAPDAWNDFAFSYSKGTDGTLTSGGGWVKAVPEPATGALALAGIALLFRRRKA